MKNKRKDTFIFLLDQTQWIFQHNFQIIKMFPTNDVFIKKIFCLIIY